MLYHKINKKTKENRKLKQKQKKTKKTKKKGKEKGYNIYLKTKALWLILTIPLNQIYSQPNKIN